MSKIDGNAINNIKLLGLDMIKEAGSGDVGLTLSMANVFYNLFLEHLNYQKDNENWFNRDRLIVNNRYLPLLYSTLHMFGFNISLDNLKEFKKMDSKTKGYLDSITNGDVLSTSAGITLGMRYLNSLIKVENPKCELLNNYTYCICTMDDLMSGIGSETLSFIGKEKLKKLIILCSKDNVSKDSHTDIVFKENMVDKFLALNFEIIEVKNSYSNNSINEAIDEAKDSKKPTIILFNTKYAKDTSYENDKVYINKPLNEEEINLLKDKYKINMSVNDIKIELEKLVNKRLDKVINKWNLLKEECIKDLKIKEIINFLENKSINIDFKSDNFKLNDNYNEELIKGNSKMFNMFASKSPFVLSLSDDNFTNTLCNISKSNNMSSEEKIGRNILFGSRTSCMGGVANGLASLGFKVFVSTPLINSTLLINTIKLSSLNNYDVHYIFTQDTLTNTYDSISAYNEINMLRLIPNLITFRPCDINEIIGIYEIIGSYKKPTAIVIGSDKVNKLIGTNPKYVVAGAYRVRRERGEANGTIIATGSEVTLALQIAEELMPYGIDLRVVSMPSRELFEVQNDRYKYSLIPNSLKTFVIEFGNTMLWNKYATSDDYIFGLHTYPKVGERLELLNNYGLVKDNIKAKIIELMKS